MLASPCKTHFSLHLLCHIFPHKCISPPSPSLNCISSSTHPQSNHGYPLFNSQQTREGLFLAILLILRDLNVVESLTWHPKSTDPHIQTFFCWTVHCSMAYIPTIVAERGICVGCLEMAIPDVVETVGWTPSPHPSLLLILPQLSSQISLSLIPWPTLSSILLL
jgi:hypothetical protein